MKISSIKENIPFPCANIINTFKHTQGFYNLGLLTIYSNKCTTKEYMSTVKVIEYMGSETPFIATEIGRNIEICSDDVCVLVKPEDL